MDNARIVGPVDVQPVVAVGCPQGQEQARHPALRGNKAQLAQIGGVVDGPVTARLDHRISDARLVS